MCARVFPRLVSAVTILLLTDLIHLASVLELGKVIPHVTKNYAIGEVIIPSSTTHLSPAGSSNTLALEITVISLTMEHQQRLTAGSSPLFILH